MLSPVATLQHGRCARCGDETIQAYHYLLGASGLCQSCGWSPSDPPLVDCRGCGRQIKRGTLCLGCRREAR